MPDTAAGKRFYGETPWWPDKGKDIEAIEAEAVAAERERIADLRENAIYLAQAAKHLTDHLADEHPDWYCEDMDTTQHFAAAVLRIVEGEDA